MATRDLDSKQQHNRCLHLGTLFLCPIRRRATARSVGVSSSQLVMIRNVPSSDAA